MTRAIFPTPQDAETAFYEALQRSDLEAMMAVWAEDEEIVCVHPGGPRLSGQDEVRASWARIFAGERPAMRVQVTQQVVIAGMMFAVHSVHETFVVEGEPRPRGPTAATNVYTRTASGWRMVAHHASLVPAPGQAPPATPEPPKILH